MSTTLEKKTIILQMAKVAILFSLHKGKDPEYKLKGPTHDEIGRWKFGAGHR